MSITIELPKEIKEKLEYIAQQQGKDIDVVIVDFLRERLAPGPSSDQNARELELLQKVHLGISTEDWERYHKLIEKRDEETLSEKEHEELLRLVNKIELANAERMKYLVELSILRREPLEEVMEQLVSNLIM